MEQHDDVEHEQQDEQEQDDEEAAISISGSLMSTISNVAVLRSWISVSKFMGWFLSG